MSLESQELWLVNGTYCFDYLVRMLGSTEGTFTWEDQFKDDGCTCM